MFYVRSIIWLVVKELSKMTIEKLEWDDNPEWNEERDKINEIIDELENFKKFVFNELECQETADEDLESTDARPDISIACTNNKCHCIRRGVEAGLISRNKTLEQVFRYWNHMDGQCFGDWLRSELLEAKAK